MDELSQYADVVAISNDPPEEAAKTSSLIDGLTGSPNLVPARK